MSSNKLEDSFLISSIDFHFLSMSSLICIKAQQHLLEKKKKEKKKSTGLVRETLKETGTPSKEVLSSFRLLDLSVKIAFSIVYIGLRTRSYRARHARYFQVMCPPESQLAPRSLTFQPLDGKEKRGGKKGKRERGSRL